MLRRSVRQLIPIGLIALAVGAGAPAAGALSAVSGGGITTNPTSPVVSNPVPPIVSSPPVQNFNGPVTNFGVSAWSVAATATFSYTGPTPDFVDVIWGDGSTTHQSAKQITRQHTPGTVTVKHAYKAGNGQAFTPTVEGAVEQSNASWIVWAYPRITPTYVVTVSSAYFKTIGKCPNLSDSTAWSIGKHAFEGSSPILAYKKVTIPQMDSQWHVFSGDTLSTIETMERGQDLNPMLYYDFWYGLSVNGGFNVSLDPRYGTRNVSESDALYAQDCTVAYKSTVNVSLINNTEGSAAQHGLVTTTTPVALG